MILKKFRYEFPPLEAHFLEAPSGQAVFEFLKLTYPHNFETVVGTMVEIPRWPSFWKTINQDGRVLPAKRESTASED